MDGEALQIWQIAACTAGLALAAAAGGWRLAQGLAAPGRPARAEAAGLGALFVGAWLLRALLSPHTLLHENAHGYELLQGAFALQGYFWHGAGYYTFFHGATRLLGGAPWVVFHLNALLGGATAVLLWAVGRRLLGPGPSAWLAAVAWAVAPVALREGGSESMMPLGLAAALLGLWAWLDGFQRGGRASSWLLAAASLSFAVQVRPELALWLTLPLLTLPACPGWTGALCRPWPWASLATFLGLVTPWLFFRIHDLSGPGLPGYLALGPDHLWVALASRDHLLLRPEWTPALFWLLVPLGLWAGLTRARRALPALLGGYLALGWLGLAATSSQATLVRCQQPLWPLVALLVGLGGAWLSARMTPRGRVAAAWVLGAALLATGLLRAPGIRALASPQREFAFLEEALQGLPRECGLVMADRFMARRVVSTEFPTWWLAGRPLAELTPFLTDPEVAASAPCWLFYRGLTCHLFSHQEEPPAAGTRPECLALEARLGPEAVIERVLPPEPYDYLRLVAPEVRLGFYRLSAWP